MFNVPDHLTECFNQRRNAFLTNRVELFGIHIEITMRQNIPKADCPAPLHLPASLAKKSPGFEMAAQRRGILSNAAKTVCNLSNSNWASDIGRLPFNSGF